MRLTQSVVVFAVLITLAAGAQADTIWDETVNGLLSSLPGSPTVVTLVSPSDQVLGDSSLNHKYFTFTIPVGNTATSLWIDPGSGGAIQVDIISAAINCGTFDVTFARELLGGGNCAPVLPPGDYTIHLDVLSTSFWTFTIASDVPVALQSLTIE